MKRLALLLLCALASACVDVPGAPIPTTDLKLTIHAPTDEVTLGESFPLTVTRVWQKDLEPGAWDAADLAPLVVRHEHTARREDSLRIEEIRRYTAFAFAIDDLVLDPVTFRATPRAGGAERSVDSRAWRLRVRPLLDPADPGEVEYPSGPLQPPLPWIPLLAGGLVLAAALVLHRRRSRAAVEAPTAQSAPAAPVPEPAHVEALARIERLRASGPQDTEGLQAFYAEAAELTRHYVQQHCDVVAPEKTNEEFVELPAVVARIDASDRRDLAEILAHCDLVRFGCHVPSDEERKTRLDAAERFVRRTSSGRSA